MATCINLYFVSDARGALMFSLPRSCGEVGGVRVVRDNRTGIGKGFAYVTFAEKSSVLFACRQNRQLEMGGRKLRVFRCKSTTSKGVPPLSVDKKPFAGVEAVPRRQWKEKRKKKDLKRKRKKDELQKTAKRRKNHNS